MTTKNILGILGIGGLIYYFTRKVSSSSKILVNITGINLDLKNPSVKVEIINPTNASFNFRSFLGNIVVNGNDAGTIDYRQETKIGANSRQVLNFPVRLKLLGAGGLLIDIIKGKVKSKLSINVNGVLNAEGFIIDVNENYEYGK